jgi:nitrate reductase delta subunit
MILAKYYGFFSSLFEYPWQIQNLREKTRDLLCFLDSIGVNHSLGSFREFLDNSEISVIQEEYVRVFDIFPLCSPYLSHHLFGDSYKKGMYMVELKRIYRDRGFYYQERELPDHMAVVMAFLSHLCEISLDIERKNFLQSYVLGGLNLMVERIDKETTPYKGLIQSVYAFCKMDSEEVVIYA